MPSIVALVLKTRKETRSLRQAEEKTNNDETHTERDVDEDDRTWSVNGNLLWDWELLGLARL